MDFTDILKRRFFKAKFKNKGLFVGKDQGFNKNSIIRSYFKRFISAVDKSLYIFGKCRRQLITIKSLSI